MSIAWFASLVVLPVVIDGPGQYVTRAGEQVTLTEAKGHASRFDCNGTYSTGERDSWHRSGRLYFGQQSQNDIVRKA